MEENNSISDKIKKNRLGCELWIYTGDIAPQIVTEKTGINHTRIREKGKPWVEYGLGKIIEHRICKENIWIYGLETVTNSEVIYLNHVLSDFLDIIKTKENEFKEIFFGKEFKSLILCYGYYYDYHLYFRLDNELLKRVNEFNLLLDFDLYSFKPPSPKESHQV